MTAGWSGRNFIRSTILAGALSAAFAGQSASTAAPRAAAGHPHWEAAAAETKVQSLDGAWMIAADPHNAGREQRWFEKGPAPEARRCRVPDVLESTFPGYDGVVWYWKDFDVRPPGPKQRLLITFHAADYLADVWVNGSHAGSHEGGEMPFSLDISRLVKAGPFNQLVVRVLNPGNDRIDGITLNEAPHGIKSVPMTVGRFWNSGGLWQSVELRTAPAVRVGRLFTDARLGDGKIAVQIAVANDSGAEAKVRMHIAVAPEAGGPELAETQLEGRAARGETLFAAEVRVPEPQPWSPDSPNLYRVTVRLNGPAGADVNAVRSGFREFLFRDGYFRLNGKRIFLRSAHAVGHYAIGQHVAHDPELLRRELIYAKTMGFNMVRWLGRTMFPSQLDLCDELGLMVYQESYASWLWNDSPKMKERFERSMREMILRDRNHPSLVAWGLLNETPDGPIFRHAAAMLPLIRPLDPSRMVLLNSGRWDGQPSIGSLANPRAAEWLRGLGAEAPGAPGDSKPKLAGGYVAQAGDAHMYVGRPWTKESREFFRTVGAKGMNVFLSEYGNGSQIDPVRLIRLFEQHGARPDLDDTKLYRGMYDQLLRDWRRWGLDQIFATPSDLFQEGERIHSEQRLIALNAIRSNPKLAGYSLTGLCDQAVEGEGLMTTFRELKKGVVDALTDGLAPLRWSVFAEPVHLYRGATLHVEAVLANEDVLAPGTYPVRLRIVGPAGSVFERESTVAIPDPRGFPQPPMVFPAFNETVVLNGPAGRYDVAVLFDHGAAPLGRQTVIVGNPEGLPKTTSDLTVWDDQTGLAGWLAQRGARVMPFDPALQPAGREVILVGGTGVLGSEADYRALMGRVAKGSVAVFLSAAALGTRKEPLASLPLASKGKLVETAGYWWGRDDVVRPHAIFDGLPSRTLMDLTFYRDLVPSQSLAEFEAGEVVVPCFAIGRPGGQGYWAGANLVIHRVGDGKVVISTLRLLENLGKHPAADRIVVNLVAWAAREIRKHE